MLIEFHYPTVAAPTTSWTPSIQHAPAPEEIVDYPDQVAIKTGDGKLFVQEQGNLVETFDLSFVGLPKADRDSYHTFFTTVKKAFHTFEFKDRLGTIHTVRIMNAFNFTEAFEPSDGSGWFDGNIELRKE